MKISANTKRAIIRFINRSRLTETRHIDYSASLIYTRSFYPKLMELSGISRIEDGIRAISLCICRNNNAASTPYNALSRASEVKLLRFTIKNISYYIGCGCIFNNKFEPILLTYTIFDKLFNDELLDTNTTTVFINNAYVNNDNVFNNFLSKKIIPVLFEQNIEVRLLDNEKIKKLVVKPFGVEMTKEGYWNLINLEQCL